MPWCRVEVRATQVAADLIQAAYNRFVTRGVTLSLLLRMRGGRRDQCTTGRL